MRILNQDKYAITIQDGLVITTVKLRGVLPLSMMEKKARAQFEDLDWTQEQPAPASTWDGRYTASLYTRGGGLV